MSSMAFGGGGLAGVARVAFETTRVQETIRDTDRVEHAYVSSLKEMSEGAIKLELAEDRRSASSGRDRRTAPGSRAPSSASAAPAPIFGRRPTASTAPRTGAPGLGKMKGSRPRYTAGYIGTTGLILAIGPRRGLPRGGTRPRPDADRRRVGRARVGALRRPDRDRHPRAVAPRLRRRGAAQDVRRVRRSQKDVDKALKLTALSADVSRARYMDLETAQQIVLKASIGMGGQAPPSRPRRRQERDPVRAPHLPHRELRHGRRGRGDDRHRRAGPDERRDRETKEALGRGLLPTVTQYTDQLTRGRHRREPGGVAARVNQVVETAPTRSPVGSPTGSASSARRRHR